MKRCKHCGELKPLTEFYPNKTSRGGRRADCVSCCRARKLKERLRDPELIRARSRAKYWADPEKARQAQLDRDTTRIRKRGDRRRELVRMRTNYAVRSGKLTRQPCEVCGDPKSQAHHNDYSKPLEVRWLCSQHHGEQHRKPLELKMDQGPW